MSRNTFKNILVVSLSNIGDVFLTLPVINVLKGNYPHAAISVVIGEKAAALLQGNPSFKEVIVYKKKEPLSRKLAFVRDLRRKRYDLVIDLKNSALRYLVGARRFNPLTVRHGSASKHMSLTHLDTLKFLKVNYDRRSDFPLYPPVVSTRVLNLCQRAGIGPEDLARAIIIAPAARTSFKAWPPEHYAALTTMISKCYSDRKIILTGSPEEVSVVDRVAADGVPGLVNFAGKLTLKEMVCLVDMAALVIANDSAAMHMGQYLGKLCVAIFGPTNAVKYGLENDRSIIVRRAYACMPCEGVRCDVNRACMLKLDPSHVFDAVACLLEA